MCDTVILLLHFYFVLFLGCTNKSPSFRDKSLVRLSYLEDVVETVCREARATI